MRGIFLITFMFIAASTAKADFDDAVIWKYSFNSGDNYSGRSKSDEKRFGSIFLHCNIHRIDSYNWNYINASYNSNRANLGLEFSSVGYDDYYQRNKYRIGAGYRFCDNIKIRPLLEISSEKFKGYDSFTGLNGELIAEFVYGEYRASIGLVDIQMKKPYEVSGNESIKPVVSGSWLFEPGMVLSVGVRRFENRRIRWIFNQFVSVNDYLALEFSYMNKPSNLTGGLEIKLKGFSLIVSYFSVSGLDDSIIWGISYGD